MSVSVKLKEPNGRIFYQRSDTTDIAEKKCALTVGTVLSSTETLPLGTPPTPAAGTYSDAVLEILIGGKLTSHHIEQMANSFALAGSAGKVDITNATVVAYATALGGTLVSGRYVR